MDETTTAVRLGCPWCTNAVLYASSSPDSLLLVENKKDEQTRCRYRCSSGEECKGKGAIDSDVTFLFSGITYEDVLQRCFDSLQQHLQTCGAVTVPSGTGKNASVSEKYQKTEEGGRRSDCSPTLHTILIEYSPLLQSTEKRRIEPKDEHEGEVGRERAVRERTPSLYFLQCPFTDELIFVA